LPVAVAVPVVTEVLVVVVVPVVIVLRFFQKLQVEVRLRKLQ
jgi:hypothetical protein